MPKYNQQERLIPDNIGNPRDKLYRNVLQDWISWDKSLLDKGKANYSRVSIVKTSDLKERLEELDLKRDKIKIASVNAINMYPSIKLSTIKKAVRLFARKLTTATKKTINLCLDLIRFGMSSTLISFGR